MEKRKKTRKGKSTDITIWSDDSVEDVMAELPDVIYRPQPSSKGKTEIFRDGFHEKLDDDRCLGTRDDDIPREDSQRSTASKGTVESEISSSTSATSLTSSAPSFARTLDKHVTAELKALTQKYTYQWDTERMAVHGRELESSNQLRAGVGASEAISKPATVRQRNMTPLERLGMGAMNRSRSCSGLFNSAVKEPERVEGVTSNHGSKPVMKPVPGLPSAYSIGPDASMAKGSEDAIIPDSEDEGESASEVTEESRPKIDLGRSLFTG